MIRRLIYGDNLAVLRGDDRARDARLVLADESVDLVYLDPPFNSARDYNVLFKQAKKDENQAQMEAFTDTWQWSRRHFDEVMRDPECAAVHGLMAALHRILGNSEMMAYLVMMAPRLVHLHRALKPTGSVYLHCDPTASHYLKLVMDVVFGPRQFRDEIVWQRSTAKGNASTRYPSAHDVLLFYSKGDKWTWHTAHLPHRKAYLDSHYGSTEDDTERRYTLGDCLNPNPNRPNLTYEWNGHTRVWRWTREKMQEMHDQGRLIYTRTGMPRYKRYLDEMSGSAVTDVWTDIPPINSQAQERMGYPTQKPVALLERIIEVSSNPGDVVLDPFCGCGTAVVAAEKLGRQWIGIDVTFLAVDLMKYRLSRDFGLRERQDYEVVGDPTDVTSARALFAQSPKQFEIWAVGKVPNGFPQPGKSGDRGIDGVLRFQLLDGEWATAVIQVKGGKLTPSHIRDFAHVIGREVAPFGLFICLEKPTKGIYQEAEELGDYAMPGTALHIPNLQIRTIQELLHGEHPFVLPQGNVARIDAGTRLERNGAQGELPGT
jgi:DNA modification methylase